VRAYISVLNADQCGHYVTDSRVPGVDSMPEPLNLYHRRLKLWYNMFFFICAHLVYILSLSSNAVRGSILSQHTQKIQSEIYLWSVR